MISDFINNPPGFILRIIIPLGIALVSGYLFYSSDVLKSLLSPGITIPFTFAKALLDGWAIEIGSKKVKRCEHATHCKYAISKIPHVRAVLTGSYSLTAKTASINDLEVILTDAWKCCAKSHKIEFKRFKGIIGDYKTVLIKSAVDPKITPNISLFIDDMQKLEEYLRENT